MKYNQRNELDFLQTKTFAGALLGTAGGALIGLMAGWSTIAVYGIDQTTFLLIVLAFTVTHGFIGAFIGLLFAQEKPRISTDTLLTHKDESQAIPVTDWPQKSTVPAEQVTEHADVTN